MPTAVIDSNNNFSLEDLSALLNTTEHTDEFASPGNFLLDLINKKDTASNLLSHVPSFQLPPSGQLNCDHFVNVSIPGISPSAAISVLQYPSPVTPASFSSPKQMTPTNLTELDHLSWKVRSRACATNHFLW